MAAYYGTLLRSVPGLLLTAADVVSNLIFLVAVVVLAVLLLLPSVSKDFADAVASAGGNPQPWALLLIVGLVLWQLLRANYRWMRLLADERDGLRARSDAAQVTRAHLDTLNSLRDRGVELRDYGTGLGIQHHETPKQINEWLVSKTQWENAMVDCIDAFAPVDSRLFVTPGTDIDMETYPDSFQTMSHELRVLTRQLKIVTDILQRFAPQARP
jgi:hypothetical protein